MCQKHPIRKRKDCPDCQLDKENIFHVPESHNTVVQVPVELLPKEEVQEEQSSKSHGPKLEKNFKVEKLKELLEKDDVTAKLKLELDRIKQETEDVINSFREKMDASVKGAIAKIQSEYNKLTNIRYEYFYVDEGEFRHQMIDNMAIQGWRFIAFVDEKLAKTYVRDRGFALFERIKR